MRTRLARLGYLALVLAAAFRPEARGTLRLLVAALLLFPFLETDRARGRLCLVAAAAQFVDLLFYHPDIDNHRYLMFATSLLVGLAHGAPHPRFALRRGSRALLAFVFLAAAGQKAAQRDFRDGSALVFFSREDARFAGLSRWVLGRRVGAAEQRAVEEALDAARPEWPVGPRRVALPAPPEPPPLGRARLLAGLVILGEAAVGVAYLAALRGGAAVAGSWLVLLFCALTYPFLPIRGFGAYLLFLGLAAAGRRRERRALVAGLILVVLVPGFFR